MIGFDLTTADLEDLIEDHKPGWLSDMQEERDDIAAGNIPSDFTSHWSKIKKVFMDLQNSKCAFCEKELEGAIENDVEHFRPKKKVKRWKVPADLEAEGIAPNQPSATEDGYAILAYHHRNYVASCKVCNTIQKKNFFPIAGTRDINTEDPVDLVSELPYLLFPIGDFDDAPEDLIEFHGLVPQPLQGGFARERALVTIALFELADPEERKILFIQRARVVSTLFTLLQIQADGSDIADNLIDRFISRESPHSRCAFCFFELFHADHAEAEDLAIAAEEFLDSVSN